MRRFEFKYLLNQPQYQQLSRLFALYGAKRDIADIPHRKGKYNVISLYYDNSSWNSYWEKQAGIKIRRKYRLRTYSLSSSPIFSEIKVKEGEMIRKHRSLLNQSGKINPKFELQTQQKNMIPRLLVAYAREPFMFVDQTHLRLTFDSQLKTTISDNLWTQSYSHQVLPDNIILEIKTKNTIPAWLHQTIRSLNLSRLSISKYCLSLEKCDIVQT